jgi:hypothetical protein
MVNTLMRSDSLWTKIPIINLQKYEVKVHYIDKFGPASGFRQFGNCSASVLIKIMYSYLILN